MTLLLLVATPLVAGIIAALAGSWRPVAARWVALLGSAAALGLSLSLLPALEGAPASRPFAEFEVPWIPAIGASFHLAVDGLSLVFVLLTTTIGVVSVVASFEVTNRPGAFMLAMLSVESGVLGVFLAFDLFLFYFAWELMLVPMTFLIGVFGHEGRLRAAIKFFLFTFIPGVLMLVALLALYFIHGARTGQYTFSYAALLGTSLGAAEWLVMLGFFAGFAVKLPVVPMHTWLPDAHTEAPTAGSIMLAALLLKTGGYGILRFVIPMFPASSASFAPFALGIAVAGIAYGAVASFAQRDFKRLVAYSSVSHMGFVLLGAYSLTPTGRQGAVLVMVAHGVTTGALFALVGMLDERCHTRDLTALGGLWDRLPRWSAMLLFFALASVGLPGLAGFPGEFLSIAGAFRDSPHWAALAAIGLVTAPVYGLWMLQRAIHGEPARALAAHDIGTREALLLAVLALATIWIGLNPGPILHLLGDMPHGG